MLAGLWLVGMASGAAAERPQRVVSMNLCTDQLAMLLAAPGQLISVSYLAQDARSSAMAEAAQGFEMNHGLAEEIAFLRPDLVLAGRYTTRVLMPFAPTFCRWARPLAARPRQGAWHRQWTKLC